LADKQIDSRAAEARDQNDKQEIDDFIKETVGFEQLDQLMETAVYAGIVR